MKLKFAAFFLLSAVILNTGVSAAADTRGAKARQTAALVAMLPASDAVFAFDIQRFLGSALPQLLSGNREILADVNRHLDEAKSKIGIDFRQFDSAVAGVSIKHVSGKEYDFDTVVLARGSVNMPALIAAAKIAANGKYREEKAGERTVYVFAVEEIAADHAAKSGKPAPVSGSQVEKLLSKEVAVTALDGGTIAIGTVAKVLDTVASTPRLDGELSGLVNRSPASVATFAARVPAGISSFIPLDNDELGKNVDSIQLAYGSMDVTASAAKLNATARTLQPQQAQGLRETLEGLQVLGKALLGSSKGADKQVYARLIEGAKFASRNNEVTIDITVAQPDIDFLIGMLNKK